MDPPRSLFLKDIPPGSNWTKLSGETVILQSSPRYWKLALIHTNPVRKPISAFGSSELIASGPGRCDENGCYEELDYADGPVRLISIISAQLPVCLFRMHADRGNHPLAPS